MFWYSASTPRSAAAATIHDWSACAFEEVRTSVSSLNASDTLFLHAGITFSSCDTTSHQSDFSFSRCGLKGSEGGTSKSVLLVVVIQLPCLLYLQNSLQITSSATGQGDHCGSCILGQTTAATATLMLCRARWLGRLPKAQRLTEITSERSNSAMWVTKLWFNRGCNS